jgi:hypothetical protein
MVSLALTLRISGKSPRYTLNTKLGDSQSLYEHFGEEKKCLSLPGFEPRTTQPADYSLHWLSYPSSHNTNFIVLNLGWLKGYRLVEWRRVFWCNFTYVFSQGSVSVFGNSSELTMEAVRSSETSVSFCGTAQHQTALDSDSNYNYAGFCRPLRIYP